MTIILLLLIFTILGFLFAQSTWGDLLTDWLKTLPGKLGTESSEDSTTSSIKQGQPVDSKSLTKWVSSSMDIPDDFRIWYLSLDNAEIDQFESALQSHASSTGLNISNLVSGGLEQQTDLRKVYVEAVSVYSQAFRKAREAIEQEVESMQKDPSAGGEDAKTTVEGKAVAEKRESRRRRSPKLQNEAAGAA